MFFDSTIGKQRRLGWASYRANGGMLRPGRTATVLFLLSCLGCGSRISNSTSSLIVELTDSNFQQQVVEADQPVLVEFWAPWCQPCLEMAPAMEKVAKEFAGRAKVARIRIDENPATASAYDVEAPPAVIVFRDGGVFKRRHGKQMSEQLFALLKDSLSDGGSDWESRGQ